MASEIHSQLGLTAFHSFIVSGRIIQISGVHRRTIIVIVNSVFITNFVTFID